MAILVEYEFNILQINAAIAMFPGMFWLGNNK